MRQLLLAIALRRLLRLLALCCVLVTLGVQGRQWAMHLHGSPSRLSALPYGLPLTPLTLPLTLFGAALLIVGLLVALLMPSAITHIVRCPDLLTPLGFLVPLETGFMPWVMEALAHCGLSAPLSTGLRMGLGLLLTTLFAAWITQLVLSAVRRKQADALSALHGLPLHALRLSPLMLAGWGVAQFLLPWSYRLLFDIAPLSAPIAGGLALVCWNLATAALLPVVMSRNLTYLKAVASGLEVSVMGLLRWLLPLLAQMALLGLVTWVFVVQSPLPPSEPLWRVHVFWTGGYESANHWVTDITQSAGAPIPSLFQTAFALLFSAFAMGIKLILVERMNPLYSYRHREMPDPYTDYFGED
ncbi:MAG TPA: hypothetical protein VKU00_05955 [Chthonomonadaceae bacterium]|nr:hypothetical protein [Chthonomonadaceae bacterium]